mgnify:CR=1 FL=1
MIMKFKKIDFNQGFLEEGLYRDTTLKNFAGGRNLIRELGEVPERQGSVAGGG